VAREAAELVWPALDLREAADLLRSRSVSSSELVEAHLSRLDRVDPVLHACVTVMAESARADARRADIQRRELGSDSMPLLGLPIALKDNFETAGVVTTAGSPSLADYRPTRDAVAVERLRRGGAIFPAKVNLDEFAYGGESANPLMVTLNPWDAASVPGGSSGGSGSAVAAGMCMAATGSDTGGSIRNPSGWCGVAGFKPTYGAIDPRGVVPLAWSLDTVGFLARTVDDCAVLFAEVADTMHGAGPARRREFVDLVHDSTTRRPRLAVASNLIDMSEPPVRAAFLDAIAEIAKQVDVDDVPLPRLDDALVTTITILTAEGAAAWESGLRTAWESYGAPVRAALDLGRLIRATDYIHAQRVREGLRRENSARYAAYDAVLMPTMGLDPRPDALGGADIGPGSVMWELEAKYTCMWNLTGSPVVSVPCAFSPSGRPLAMQVVAAPGHDQLALQTAAFLEACWAIPRADLVPEWVRRNA
jgi:aspartyl-tRNA(Asn)/glutamyl-tRNA(Gln) amidotransferase subunit A